MSTMAVTANASVNTVLSGPPPPPRQSIRKRTAAAVSTRGANREAVAVEEELSLSQTGADNVYGKDLSHTIRGETVLESIPSSKNVPTAARKILKSPIPQSPRTSNPNNPSIPKAAARLQYLGGILAFIVFVLLAGLGTTFWNWSSQKNKSSGLLTPLGLSVSEGRISELEKFLKTTTRMMQDQLESVDKKIGKQVENLRKELEDKIEEQTATFLTELRNVQAHTEEIEGSLLKLADTGVMSKREVLELVNSVVDEWAVEAKGQALSLDDVRAVAKRIVEAEIEKHSADGLGKVDYALGSGGGKVVRHSEGYFVVVGKNWGLDSLNFLRKSFGSVHPYASKILEPSFGEPGQCLPLKSNNVFVDIGLRTSVLPEAITLEHVAEVAETRFASHTIVLRRLVRVKEALCQMVISNKWGGWKQVDTEKAKIVKDLIFSDDFWNRVEYALELTEPLMSMLRYADTDEPCLGNIYDAMDSMLERMKSSVAYDRSSAPKDFRIFGWLSQYKDDTNIESEQMFLLGEFSYDLEKGSAQTFNLPVESTGNLINMIKLDVLSNHGSPSHTCIYRLRVHGSEPKSPMEITNEL